MLGFKKREAHKSDRVPNRSAKRKAHGLFVREALFIYIYIFYISHRFLELLTFDLNINKLYIYDLIYKQLICTT
jgi:hypothetical protein